MNRQFTYILIVATLSFSTLCRELGPNEVDLARRASDLNRDNQIHISKLKNSFDIKQLPISKYLSFVILKNGCAPFLQTLEEIRHEDESYPDQSAGLQNQLKICLKANMALRNFDPNEVESVRLSEE